MLVLPWVLATARACPAPRGLPVNPHGCLAGFCFVLFCWNWTVKRIWIGWKVTVLRKWGKCCTQWRTLATPVWAHIVYMIHSWHTPLGLHFIWLKVKEGPSGSDPQPLLSNSISGAESTVSWERMVHRGEDWEAQPLPCFLVLPKLSREQELNTQYSTHQFVVSFRLSLRWGKLPYLQRRTQAQEAKWGPERVAHDALWALTASPILTEASKWKNCSRHKWKLNIGYFGHSSLALYRYTQKNDTLKTESCLIIRSLHLGRMHYDPIDLSENRFQKEMYI